MANDRVVRFRPRNIWPHVEISCEITMTLSAIFNDFYMQIETCVVKLGIPIGASDVTINITLGLLRFVARTKTGKNKQNYKKRDMKRRRSIGK